MTRRSSALIAACLGVLVGGSVQGTPRNAPARDTDTKTQVLADPVAEYAAQLTKIDSWLKALVGRYRLSIEGATIEGTADCAGIGTGPGVHCILGFSPVGQKDRTSTVMLFGVDTSNTKAPLVQRFQINGDSTGEMGLSRLRSDAITFIEECPVIQHYPPESGVIPMFCQRDTRVLVKPGDRFVRIRQSTVERVVVRTSDGSRYREFFYSMSLTLERVQAPQGTSR